MRTYVCCNPLFASAAVLAILVEGLVFCVQIEQIAVVNVHLKKAAFLLGALLDTLQCFFWIDLEIENQSRLVANLLMDFLELFGELVERTSKSKKENES